MLAFTVLAFLSALGNAIAARLITIVNRCPQTITLYINGQTQGSLANGGATNRTFEDSFSGLIYTDANGGSSTGALTTRAGFYSPTNYYYIVKDTSRLNTGISIVPKVLTSSLLSNGFCATDSCDSTGCSSVYTSPPTSFPVPTSSPPASPLAECPGTDVGYTVTFCPEKTFPPTDGSVTVRPGKSATKCLDVRGAVYASGTVVQIYDCNETSAQRWVLKRDGENTSIALAGTTFCVDAGQNPTSGSGLTIQPCVAGSASQTWIYSSSNNHIKQTANNKCADLTDGILTNGNHIQSWTCIDGNLNQNWSFS